MLVIVACALTGLGCAPTVIHINDDGDITVATASMSELSMVTGGMVFGGEYATALLTVIDQDGFSHERDVVMAGWSMMMTVGVTVTDDLGNLPSGASYDVSDVSNPRMPDLMGTFQCGRFGMVMIAGGEGIFCNNDAGTNVAIGGVHMGFEIEMLGIGEITIGVPVVE